MIAVIEEDISLKQMLEEKLTEEGFSVNFYHTTTDALYNFKISCPKLLIIKMRSKNSDEINFLKQIQREYSDIITLAITTLESDDPDLETLSTIVHHYLPKSWKVEDLILQVKKAFEKNNYANENTNFNFEYIIGKCPTLREIVNLIKIVSQSTANVLITGESGTGKELVARALHNTGPRKSRPFIPLNCTAIPEHLLESELFGHARGSFTGALNDKKGLFEEAEGGTIFLDEIGDLSLGLQAKLLRVLQDKQIRAVGANRFKQINARIIAATHCDLKSSVKNGKFREDLFYRLNVIPIRVPPLRERKEDIPLLVENFIHKFSLQNESQIKDISKDAMAVLMAYSWPGNVRELENAIERAIVLSTGKVLEKNVLLTSTTEESKVSIQQIQADRPTLEKLEERYIKKILSEVSNKKNEAAQVLGISRRTLYRKERIYGLITESREEAIEDEQTINEESSIIKEKPEDSYAIQVH